MENIVEKPRALTKKPRKSNLEWLRIVSMICIIAHHLALHGVYPETIPTFSLVIQTVFNTVGKLGVNCFVLISGYFLLKSRFSWRKVIRLVATVWVYSVALYLGFALGNGTFNGEDFVQAFFPIIFNQYWFMTAYMIAYLLSPLLAILLRACSRQQHALLALFLFVTMSLMNVVPGVNIDFPVGWFLFLMVFGAYLSQFPDFTSWMKSWMALILFLFLWVAIIAAEFFGGVNLFDLQHPVCLLWTVLLFLTFANAKAKSNKLVNKLAAGTLGVYLLHDNNYMREHLWNEWLRVGYHAESETFIIFAVIVVLVIWVVCTSVDTLRQFAFSYVEKGIDTLLHRIRKITFQK